MFFSSERATPVALGVMGATNKKQGLMLFRTASRSLMGMSERDARGPEDHDKPSFILGGSVSSPVENWSGALQ